MDGENQNFFLFSESGVLFFQLCLLKQIETLLNFFIAVSGFLEAEFQWKIKGKLWLHSEDSYG